MSFIENFDLSYRLTLDLSFFFIIIIFWGEKIFGGQGALTDPLPMDALELEITFPL